MPVYGTSVLVQVFIADFWYVCHWHYVVLQKELAQLEQLRSSFKQNIQWRTSTSEDYASDDDLVE